MGKFERYTHKIAKKSNYYCGYEIKNCPYNEIYNIEKYSELEDYANPDLTLAIDFLGEIEDVLKKYNIKNANELDKKLQYIKQNKGKE